MSNAVKSLSEIIVEIYSMGTLPGDAFLELQSIFQTYMADMGATPLAHISQNAIKLLSERGFITAHYNYSGHYDGEVPSARALNALQLELAQGGRCMEPRDAYDARLVAIVPVWCEQPYSALGVSAYVR
jgi:hypothetical protein